MVYIGLVERPRSIFGEEDPVDSIAALQDSGAEARGQLHKASVMPASLLAGTIEPSGWD